MGQKIATFQAVQVNPGCPKATAFQWCPNPACPKANFAALFQSSPRKGSHTLKATYALSGPILDGQLGATCVSKGKALCPWNRSLACWICERPKRLRNNPLLLRIVEPNSMGVAGAAYCSACPGLLCGASRDLSRGNSVPARGQTRVAFTPPPQQELFWRSTSFKLTHQEESRTCQFHGKLVHPCTRKHLVEDIPTR